MAEPDSNNDVTQPNPRLAVLGQQGQPDQERRTGADRRRQSHRGILANMRFAFNRRRGNRRGFALVLARSRWGDSSSG